MNKLVLRQLRSTVLLLIALVLILSLAFYLHWTNSFVEETPATNATHGDISEALIRYKSLPEDEMAQLHTASNSTDHPFELVFSGLPGTEITTRLVEILAQHQLHPTFFLTLSEAANSDESIALLLEKGCSVGIWGNGSGSLLNDADPEGLVEHLCRTAVILRARHGVACDTLLTTMEPGSESLRAAAAVGVNTVTVTPYQIDLAQCLTTADAAALLEDIPLGAVVQVRINRRDTDPAAGLVCLLEAMAAADPYAPYRAMLATLDEAQELPAPMQRIHTSEKAVCLTFSGLGNSSELTSLLDALAAQDAKATFFVDHQEVKGCKQDIRRILSAGHELGIKPVDDLSDDETLLLYQLALAEQALRDTFQYEGTLLARSGIGRPSQAMVRAAAAGGYTLVSNILAPVQAGDERVADAASVLEKTLPEGKRVLQRGEILHLRMNFYRSGDTILSDLVTAFLTQRSIYPAKTLSAVMNSELCYAYPLPEEAILPQVRGRIHQGQLTQELMDIFPSQYVGTDWINNELTLPGFTPQEISQLDTLGLIPNEDNMVFLTFDDWGSDANLNRILEVLGKHNAKATFFVYTENVVNNPNLLRAIAMEGHAIASHTHRHAPLSNTMENTYGYYALNAQQVTDLRADLITSYQTMEAIIGDISIGGVPALTPYFRPPTLALSREGVEAVYDTGYTWIVSGSCSTDDYIATDVDSLVDNMLAGTQSGAVLVMHMTDSSIHTADTLDAYLTQLEAGEVQYRFATLTEALGLD